MIERECYECGRRVSLPDDTFTWDCTCGYKGQRTELPQGALLARFRDDDVLARIADELLDAYEIRAARDAADERARVAGVARTLDAIVAGRDRLIAARSPDRSREAELAAVTDGLDGAAAWRALAELGRVPAPDDSARQFTTEAGLDACPEDLEICFAFARDVPAALAAETAFRALCDAAGIRAPIVWGSLTGAGSLGTVDALRDPLARCVPRGVDDDELAVAIAAELHDGRPNPFVPLRELFATGVTLEQDSEGLIMLCLP